MRIVRKHKLALLFFLALLPAMLLRDFTPSNELRYLSIADEALRDGHIFAFFNHGLMYADKPPLYLWLVMLGRYLFGGGCMLFLSLFSLIPAIVIVRTMRQWTAAELPADQSDVARFMLFTCGLFPVMAVTLRMDMLMVMFIVLALRRFSIMEQRAQYGWHNSWRFAFYVFMAIFSKGPLGILIPLVSILVYALWTRRPALFFRAWNGRTFLVLIALCAAWFSCAYLEGGAPYLNEMLFHQTMGRAVNAFHHKRPFYFYLVALLYTMLPWLPYIVITACKAIRRRISISATERLFISIIASTFIMLSAFSSKLQVYLLPIFPFAVYLGVLLGVRTGCTCRLSRVRRFAYGLLIVIFLGGLALPWINPYIGYRDACREATRQQALLPADATRTLYTFNVRRPENIDAYGLQPFEVTDTTRIDLAAQTFVALAAAGHMPANLAAADSTLVGNLVVFTHRPCPTAP